MLSRAIESYIESDDTLWERERFARGGELLSFVHRGFWRPIDTLRDRQQLEDLWASGAAAWRIWSYPSSQARCQVLSSSAQPKVANAGHYR